ncbi:MAG: DUF4255 domain-containing protein [Acetobacteraceae bacterium]|jgi:hypothetical protein
MDLIRNALKTICDQANTYLANIDPRPDSWVVLTSLVDHGGAINDSARDKIVMVVYNITRDAFASSYQPTAPASPGANHRQGLPVTAPPLYLNVHLMFMANFTEDAYPDGLAALSRVIEYFQQTSTFTPQNAPKLSPEIDQLALEFENLTTIDVNYVMSMLGTRYLPSAFYKLRMIPFAPSAMVARTYPVAGAATGISPGANAAP